MLVAAVVLALSAVLIKGYGPGTSWSLISYGSFCGGAAFLFAAIGVVACFVEALQGIIMLVLDGLASFFLLAGGIVSYLPLLDSRFLLKAVFLRHMPRRSKSAATLISTTLPTIETHFFLVPTNLITAKILRRLYGTTFRPDAKKPKLARHFSGSLPRASLGQLLSTSWAASVVVVRLVTCRLFREGTCG